MKAPSRCPAPTAQKLRPSRCSAFPSRSARRRPARLMGPAALRTAGIARVLEQLGLTVEDHGDLAKPAPVSSNDAAARQRQILRRDQELDPRAQRARLCAGAQRRDPDLHGRRSQPVDGIGQRRRAPLAANRAGRCSCCGSTPMPTTTRRPPPSPATCTACRRRSCAASPASTACSATSRACRSHPIGSICSASARSTRWRESWCASAASRSPTCARSTSSASAS